jgi:hypothetical protein
LRSFPDFLLATTRERAQLKNEGNDLPGELNVMNANDIVLLALKRKVTAIARSDGHHIWCTEIRGGSIIDDFITLACDDSRVFAYCGGHLHCLDLSSGRLLWTDDLPGYGFRLASICIPGYGSAPDGAALKHLMAQRDAATVSSAIVAATAT